MIITKAESEDSSLRNLLNIVKYISSLPDVSGDDCHNINESIVLNVLCPAIWINESKKCVNATIVSTVQPNILLQ